MAQPSIAEARGSEVTICVPSDNVNSNIDLQDHRSQSSRTSTSHGTNPHFTRNSASSVGSRSVYDDALLTHYRTGRVHSAYSSTLADRDSTAHRESTTGYSSTCSEAEQEKGMHDKVSDHSSNLLPGTDVEKQRVSHGGLPPRKQGILSRFYLWFRRSYWPIEDPALILPSAPTDDEKYLYLHTNRIPLYIVGIFAFLALSAGMWLFVICSKYVYWLGIFTSFLQIYLFISYLVGVVGRDFDFGAHERVLQKNILTKENAPSVDIFLPCCKEPLEVIENTYKYVAALDYPRDIKVHVMDDGADEDIRVLAEKYGFNYSVRDDRPRLRKAGNLRWSFTRTQGDFFAIFDADFCPRADFLLELIPEHLEDETTAIVQTPQYFRTTKQHTWVEQGAGATQELFYRVVQVNRNKWGASICVGSNAVYRRTALEAVGGTAEIGFSEDVHTGFGAVDRGWKVKYLPLNLACGVCPDNPRAFFSQQMRWCMGSTTLLTNLDFWKSKLTFMQKLCYSCGFLYYSAVTLSIFISPIPGVVLLWIRPDLFKYYNLAFAIPSIVYGVILFPLWAKGRYGFNVQHIQVIQSYAYLNAIKDKLCGFGLQWVPTGDSKQHKSNKYRNMRIVAWIWWLIVLGGMISAVSWRVIHGLPWYHTLPLILLNAYNFYLAHPFLFYYG